MLYIKDQYGNSLGNDIINDDWRIINWPTKSKIQSTTLAEKAGAYKLQEPRKDMMTVVVGGKIIADSKQEATDKILKIREFCSRGMLMVGDDDFDWRVEGEKESISHPDIRNTNWHLFDFRLTVKCYDPYLQSDEVIEEMIITPSDYPTQIDMANPDPRANVKFGNYNVDTGVLVTEENDVYIAGEHISTTSLGDGFSFNCVGGFSLLLFHNSSSRKIKIFDNDIFLEEIIYPVAVSEWLVNGITKFDDNKIHRITVINSGEGFMEIEKIFLTPSNLITITNTGTADSDVKMVFESPDTKAVITPLGKISGDEDHPFMMGNIEITDIANIDPTQFTNEIWQASYDLVAFNNGSTSSSTTSTAEKYAGRLLKFNLKAFQSPYYSMTNDGIRDFMQSILVEVWTHGVGVNVGEVENGVEMYVWTDGESWSTSYRGNTYNLPSKVTWNLDEAWNPSRFVDDTGKIYFLLKSKYPSDGINPSSVYLDHCRLTPTHNLCKLSDDIVTNTVKNLSPPFTSSEWVMSDNMTVNDEYDMVLNSPTSNHDNSYVRIYNTPPNKSYSFSWLGTGVIMIMCIDQEGVEINRPFNYTEAKKGTFITPPNIGRVNVYFGSGAQSGTFNFKNFILTPTDAIQPFRPREKKVISLLDGEEAILTTDDELKINPREREINLNETRQYSKMTDDFKFIPLTIAPNFNQLLFNHTGGNLKATLKYKKKWE